MKNKIFTFKSITVLLVLAVMLISPAANAQEEDKFGVMSFNKAVNVSGKQRMLTQKMAKSYIYLYLKPTDSKAKRDLLTSKIIFEKQNNILNQNAGSALTKNKIEEVEELWADFKSVLDDNKANYLNVKKILEQNTELLRATNNTVSAVINESKIASQNTGNLFEDGNEQDAELKNIINTAGRQRMLSQRLALYYFGVAASPKTKELKMTLSNVHKEIDDAITMLLISNFNDSRVDEKLGVAMSKWEILRDNKDKLLDQGFEAEEIYQITNSLTKAFNDITAAYESIKQ